MYKIIIYGILPPPFGGVSIYHKRLINSFQKKKVNFLFIKSNQRDNKEPKQTFLRHFVLKMLNFNKQIIHVSGIGSTKIQFILIFLNVFFFKKIIVTIHNDRLNESFYSVKFYKKVIGILFFKSVSRVIFVNPKAKVNFINNNKISTIPAFIPPSLDELYVDQLPNFFHALREKHKFLITANAFKITFHNKEDLYGIDLSIELMKKLKENGYDDVGFIYVIPEIGDHIYFQKMQQLVELYNISDRFHFYTKPIPYPAVINMCDIFIRPTNTDGFGNSIAEAVFLKKPAIASNVCSRPDGTILFKSRDVNDLYNKVTDVLDNYQKHKKRIDNISFEDNVQKIIDIYNKVLS